MNEAYLEFLERQAGRGLNLLPDRAGDVDRKQRDFERRQLLATAFGHWLANSLGPWDWFINPISFRDRHPDLERNPQTGLARHFQSIETVGQIRVFANDPRLKGWKPDFSGRRNPGPPVPDKAIAEIKDFLCELQEAAEKPIRWMLAEEFGRVDGRYHCHGLVAGVAHLQRSDWWQKAFERFGRTRIEAFDPERGGAFYAAKYASKLLGALHFGGPVPNSNFTANLQPRAAVGGADIVPSANMARDEIRRLENYPRGWPGWRRKR